MKNLFNSEKITVDRTSNTNDLLFKEIVSSYYQELCAFSVQFTDSPSETEDLVQDVLLRFWEEKKYQLANSNLRGYIFQAVRNASIDYIRKNKHYIFENLEEACYLMDDEINAKEMELQHQRLHDLLKQLPSQEYRALIAVFVDNKKYKDVADEMGISTNTLKTHLSRAMKFLRKNNIKMITFFLFY